MDMLKKIAIKEIIEENRELRDCNDTYKYIIEKALNINDRLISINDRLISEIAIREEEIELLKREKEELKKINIILSNDNSFINNKYQKLKSNLKSLIKKYSGGN